MVNWKDIFPTKNRYYESNNGILYNENNIKILKQFPDESIDIVITSPPYLNVDKYKQNNVKIFKTKKEYISWFLEISNELYKILKYNGVFILNLGDVVINKERSLYPFILAEEMRKQNWKLWDLLIWNKMKGLPLQKRFSYFHEYLFIFVKDLNSFHFNIDNMRVPYKEISLKRMQYKIKKRYSRDKNNQNKDNYKDWEYNKKGALPQAIINISSEYNRQSDIHFAVFPEELVEYLLKGFIHSNYKKIILDPFIGSGTTGIICERLKQYWVGIDIVKDYCKESKKRIEKEYLMQKGKLF